MSTLPSICPSCGSRLVLVSNETGDYECGSFYGIAVQRLVRSDSCELKTLRMESSLFHEKLAQSRSKLKRAGKLYSKMRMRLAVKRSAYKQLTAKWTLAEQWLEKFQASAATHIADLLLARDAVRKLLAVLNLEEGADTKGAMEAAKKVLKEVP